MRCLAIFCALCALASAHLPALADGSGSVSVSTAVSTFSAPAGSYGPWVSEDLDVQLPPSGSTGIHVENRRASDRFNPTIEYQAGVDTYRTLSRRMTLYGSAFFGSGAPYPRDRFSGEVDLKAGHGIVPFAGGALGSGYGIGATNQLTAGAYYYFGDNYFSARYTPSWSQVLGATQSYQFAVALGHSGRTMTTVRAGGGGENDISLISPINPTLIGEREFDAGVSVKHWTSAATGFHVDLDYGNLRRAGGARIYSRNGIGAGFFFGLR